jgi:hypothetical protein
MNKTKEELQKEIEADFNGDFKYIGLVLFLNGIVKLLHTRFFIFIATAISPYSVGFCLWYYYQKPLPQIIVLVMLVHLVSFLIFLAASRDLDETYGYFKNYEEVLIELKKKSRKNKSTENIVAGDI